MTLKVEQNPKKAMARNDARWHEKTRQGTRRHDKAREDTVRHEKTRARGHGARGHGMFPTQVTQVGFILRNSFICASNEKPTRLTIQKFILS